MPATSPARVRRNGTNSTVTHAIPGPARWWPCPPLPVRAAEETQESEWAVASGFYRAPLVGTQRERRPDAALGPTGPLCAPKPAPPVRSQWRPPPDPPGRAAGPGAHNRYLQTRFLSISMVESVVERVSIVEGTANPAQVCSSAVSNGPSGCGIWKQQMRREAVAAYFASGQNLDKLCRTRMLRIERTNQTRPRDEIRPISGGASNRWMTPSVEIAQNAASRRSEPAISRIAPPKRGFRPILDESAKASCGAGDCIPAQVIVLSKLAIA